MYNQYLAAVYYWAPIARAPVYFYTSCSILLYIHIYTPAISQYNNRCGNSCTIDVTMLGYICICKTAFTFICYFCTNNILSIVKHVEGQEQLVSLSILAMAPHTSMIGFTSELICSLYSSMALAKQQAV